MISGLQSPTRTPSQAAVKQYTSVIHFSHRQPAGLASRTPVLRQAPPGDNYRPQCMGNYPSPRTNQLPDNSNIDDPNSVENHITHSTGRARSPTVKNQPLARNSSLAAVSGLDCHPNRRISQVSWRPDQDPVRNSVDPGSGPQRTVPTIRFVIPKPYVASTMLKDELKRSTSYGFFSAYSKETRLHIQNLSSLTFTVAFADHGSFLLKAEAAGNSMWQSWKDWL